MKKLISLMLVVGLCVGVFSSCDGTGTTTVTTSDDTTDHTDVAPTVETVIAYDDYEYHNISFDHGNFYSPPYIDSGETIITDGVITIEHVYYSAMLRISNYVSIVDHYLKNQSADAEDLLLSKYFQQTSMSEYVKHYDVLMLNAVQLLHDNGFAPSDLSANEILDFMNGLEYGTWGKERYTVLALGYMGIEEYFIDCVENLLIFADYCADRYPDGNYSLFLSESDMKLIHGLSEAAEAIHENSAKLRSDWTVYYLNSMAGLQISVTEEFIPEKHAMKIVIQSDAKCMVDVPTQYIENLAHTVGENGIVKSPKDALMSPVVVYLPLSYYNAEGGHKLPMFYITTYNENNEGYEEAYRMQIDPRSYYSEESLTLPDAFLHRIMQSLFGASYSEKDLINVYTVMFYQWADGTLKVRITYFQNNSLKKVKEFEYEALMGEKAPAALTAEMQESLTYFHGLFSVSGNQGYQIPHELWDEIKPYSVAEEWQERLYG